MFAACPVVALLFSVEVSGASSLEGTGASKMRALLRISDTIQCFRLLRGLDDVNLTCTIKQSIQLTKHVRQHFLKKFSNSKLLGSSQP
jgi:hypothetical protein